MELLVMAPLALVIALAVRRREALEIYWRPESRRLIAQEWRWVILVLCLMVIMGLGLARASSSLLRPKQGSHD